MHESPTHFCWQIKKREQRGPRQTELGHCASSSRHHSDIVETSRGIASVVVQKERTRNKWERARFSPFSVENPQGQSKREREREKKSLTIFCVVLRLSFYIRCSVVVPFQHQKSSRLGGEKRKENVLREINLRFKDRVSGLSKFEMLKSWYYGCSHLGLTRMARFDCTPFFPFQNTTDGSDLWCGFVN